jgi:hypothetical protein
MDVQFAEPVCRPSFVEAKEAFFEAEEMRHPCISPKIGDEFIPNTLRVGHPHQPLILLTGSFSPHRTHNTRHTTHDTHSRVFRGRSQHGR